MSQTIGTTIVAGVAILGWWIVGLQQRHAVRRNMRIDYLLNAYRQLERASNRVPTSQHGRAIEEAVADIYLLGTPKQVQLAAEFSKNFAQEGGADLTLLLTHLRNSLRRELLLEADESPRVSLRVGDQS